LEKAAGITAVKKQAPTNWRWLRRASQALFFILFLYLLLITLEAAVPAVHDLFFDLDPLIGISSMLASRSWIVGASLGLITLVMTVLLGRAWCGWVCPMGTVLDWVPSRKTKRDAKDIAGYWRYVKYGLLLAVLFSALLGSLSLIFLDPITLLFRTLASSILPGLSWILKSVESWFYNFSFLSGVAGWMDSSLRPWLINEQTFQVSSYILLAVFSGVLTLNAVRSRFWCRYLCPLGGLLAFVAKGAQFRLKASEAECKSCGRCSTVCPTGAIDAENRFAVKVEECTLCLKCVDSCRFNAFKFSKPEVKQTVPDYDASRRQFFYTLGAGIAAGVLLKYLPLITTRKTNLFVRPPGATEESLQNKCIRCGECIKVCPTGAIQPSSSANEWDTLWTPRLDLRKGYCVYSCNSCGQVCPTGAIYPLSLVEKRHYVMGKALIDEKRCIAYVEQHDCGVCEEMCPVPTKAITNNEQFVTNKDQRRVKVKFPVVSEMCIGCGICEAKCPVEGEAAIKVYPVA
jgi:MauM/NapG family ferredoxin protein